MLSGMGMTYPAQLANRLGGTCSVLPYHGGLMMQAGLYPQPSYINPDPVLNDYRCINDLTKALRFYHCAVPIINAPHPLDYLTETSDWARRFDWRKSVLPVADLHTLHNRQPSSD